MTFQRLTSPEWERARVLRWMEITMADPMWPVVPDEVRGYASKERMGQFEARFRQLEAELPTPEAA